MTSKPSGTAVSIGQQSWQPPSHLGHPSKPLLQRDGTPTPSHTPSLVEDATMVESAAVHMDGDNAEEESQRALFKDLYLRSEAKIAALFGGGLSVQQDDGEENGQELDQLAESNTIAQTQEQAPSTKPARRTIDEDNYDDEEDEDDADDAQASPL